MNLLGPEAQTNCITEVTRRNIVDEFLLRNERYHGRLDEASFFGRIWNLSALQSTDRREPNLDADLRRHIPWNDDGYDDAGVLYGKLKILRCPDEEFGRFLAECLHPIVRQDATEVASLRTLFNKHLAADGFILVESSRMSGRPVYEMTRIDSPLAVKTQHYDVALSFAGEQRGYVEAVALRGWTQDSIVA